MFRDLFETVDPGAEEKLLLNNVKHCAIVVVRRKAKPLPFIGHISPLNI